MFASELRKKSLFPTSPKLTPVHCDVTKGLDSSPLCCFLGTTIQNSTSTKFFFLCQASNRGQHSLHKDSSLYFLFLKPAHGGFRRWTAGVLQAESEDGSSPVTAVTAARPRGCETAMPTFFLAELRQRRRQKCGQISEAVSKSFSIFALQH